MLSRPILEGSRGLKKVGFRSGLINGYDLSKSSIDDLYHRFPTMFDEQIIKEGQLYGINGNSSMYYSSGHINGTLGIYTIGINNETGIIYHRCFYSMDRFLKDFKFPR